jgi:transcription-repair coupling factor (superfamily II helicase)
VLACDPERIRARAADLVRTSQEFLAASWVNAAAGGQAPIDLGAAAFRSITEIRAAADDLGLPWWTVTPFESPGAAGGDAAGLTEPGGAEEDQAGRPSFSMGAGPAEAYRGDTTRALADVRRWLADQWRVVLVTEGHGPGSATWTAQPSPGCPTSRPG